MYVTKHEYNYTIVLAYLRFFMHVTIKSDNFPQF